MPFSPLFFNRAFFHWNSVLSPLYKKEYNFLNLFFVCVKNMCSLELQSLNRSLFFSEIYSLNYSFLPENKQNFLSPTWVFFIDTRSFIKTLVLLILFITSYSFGLKFSQCLIFSCRDFLEIFRLITLLFIMDQDDPSLTECWLLLAYAILSPVNLNVVWISIERPYFTFHIESCLVLGPPEVWITI